MKKNGNLKDIVFNADVSGDGLDGNSFVSKAFLYQIDPKVNRMFLFVNSDRQPYSATRHDSLMLAGKDIANYNFFGLKNPALTDISEPKESVMGSTNTLNLTDDDYVSSAIVSSSKTVSNFRSFFFNKINRSSYRLGI